jgi:hypothetical protein
MVHWLYQQPPKEGGRSFYICPKKLAVGNYPVKTETSGFETGIF